MNLFYTDPAQITGSRLKLTGQEAVHAGTVLRYKQGDSIAVTDGCGHLYYGEVVAIGRTELDVHISRTEFRERPNPEITIAMGLIKKRDRLEFAVEKAVELGASRIVLFRGKKSEKTGLKMSRIESTVMSAMKQSLRCWLPETDFYETLGDALEQKGSHHLLFADETMESRSESADKSQTPSSAGISEIKPSTASAGNSGVSHEGAEGFEGEGTGISELSSVGKIFAVIGPEGGFSKTEKSHMIGLGASRLSLGPYRLRTETAVISLVSRLMSGR